MKRLACALLLMAAGIASANELGDAEQAWRAKQSPATLKQREERAADLAYWTGGYKGEDLVAGKYACPMPKIPVVSKDNAEIGRVQAEIAQWEACYNDFVANVNQAPKGEKRIPADVLKLMSPRETEQAVGHVNDAMSGVIARRRNELLAFNGERDAWYAATEKFVNEANAKTAEDKRRFEEEQQQVREGNDAHLRRLGTKAQEPVPQREWGKKN